MLRCVQCGAENGDGDARFCSRCGAAFAQDPGSPSEAVVVPAAADVPVAVANGRYELARLLGEGGKKIVYLAKDSLLGREVALALIKADGLDAGGRERVLREAQAMGRLGAHPNIVAVFDLGEEQGRPFMVTELMGGGDLEGLLEKAPGGKLPVGRVVELGRGVCNGLVFAHGQGVIHRDLKPGNVWLTADGQPKIGDFGLALASERSRLTQEGTMVGTVSYMPPEQALGGETTPRADLYSLGAMLYELLTGRPPFLADDPIAVISQHINTPPVAPSWHTPGCPRALEALVLRLLAKDPSERPSSAADVLAALDAIDLGETAPTAESSGDAGGLEGLAGGVFVGRRQELGALKAALEGVLSGEGRMVTLAGEPGIGKTRVALELATYARLRGAEVLWGRCYESEGAPAYWPWVQALRDHVRETEAQELLAELGAGAAAIAEIVPDIRQRLPGLPEPSRLDDPQQARFRLFDALAAFLRSASRARPIVLVLDDLHWADDGTLRLLEFVARELIGTRVLLVGTYRDIDLGRRHPLSTTLAELTRERLFERMLLRGLQQEDIGRFVEATCGLPVPESLIGLIHTQTEGNPLFVTEIVRLLVQEGALTPERLSGEQSWSLRIPEGVREVIGRRLDRLSEQCNETLTLAAVIGREFGHDQLNALIEDVSDDRLLDMLDEALAAHVIEEFPRSPGRYQFSHALIQETLTGELSLTRRVRLHARIAEALEQLYGTDADRHADELARHYAEAQSLLGPDRLVHYSVVGGEQALGAHAHEQALAHFERASAAHGTEGDDLQTATILYGLGRAQLASLEAKDLGRPIANLQRALDSYRAAGDRERAVEIATYPFAWEVTSHPGAVKLVNDALELVPPESVEAGRLQAQRGFCAGMIEADYATAAQAFQRALEIARHQRDETLERIAMDYSGWVNLVQVRWREALQDEERALELAVRAGDEAVEMRAGLVAGISSFMIGDWQQAREQLERSLALAERFHDRTTILSASALRVWMLTAEGAWEAARAMGARSPHAVHDPRHAGGQVLLEHEIGDLEAGTHNLARLRDLAGSVPPPGPQAEHALLAAYLAVVALLTDSDEQFREAEQAAVSGDVPGIFPIWSYAAKGARALGAIHRRDAATCQTSYDTFVPFSGTLMPFTSLPVDRLLGLLAQTGGHIDAAVQHFEDALAFCERAGARTQLAWSGADYAELLLDRDGPGDHGRAIALQDTALAIARELGMQRLMQCILARRELLKA